MKTKIILSLIVFSSVYILMAQGAPPATPIDGGLSALLVAGGIYGLRKLTKMNKG